MSKKCMVFETLGSVTEMKKQATSNSNEIRLSGVFGVCGVRNNNHRIYSKENYGQMIECLQNTIMNEGVLGELEHPDSMNINLNNVSHKIESVEMNEDGTVTGTIVILNTDKGRNAKAIVEAGVPLYISSRALGSIDENGNVTLTSLKTYDLVGTPGFSQARLNQLKESNQTFESLNESCVAIILEEENKDENPKDEGSEKKEPKDEPKENKENNDNKSVTMEDLKKSIDELSSEVKSLSASLHVTTESLKEKEAIINDLQQKLDEVVSCNYDAIEKWIREEYSPIFKENLVDNISEGTEKYIKEEFAPLVEGWAVKEFAPMVEGWVTKEFAPIIESWVTKEFAPIVESWTVNHFGESINEWMTQEVKKDIVDTMTQNVSEFMESKMSEIKESKFDNIDRMLEAIASSKTPEQTLIKENQQVNNRYASYPAIMNMPNEYRPLWEMLDESRKDNIAMMSRAYDFTKNGVLESFWAGIDFKGNNQSIKESQANPQSKTINSIAAMMMKMRGRH